MNRRLTTAEYLKAEFPGVVERGLKDLYDASIGELFRRVESNPQYGNRFLATLELNKYESENICNFQVPRMPKTLDDLSIVDDTGIELCKKLGIKYVFKEWDLRKIRETLEENKEKGTAHISLSSIEKVLQGEFPSFQEQYVLKTTDKFGLLIGVKVHDELNPEIVRMIETREKDIVKEAIRKVYGELN